MKKEYAQYLLQKTKEDYNLIAEEWSTFRGELTPEMKKYGSLAKEGERILDLGCGSGRFSEYFENKNIEYFGSDISEQLIEIAKKQYPDGNFVLSDYLKLPFPDNYIDKVYSLAVLHHIPSVELRLQFLQEAKRILKPNGTLVIGVWNLWHLWCEPFLWPRDKNLRKHFKQIIKYTLLKIFGLSKLDFKDIFIPWRNITMRYIHCFTKGELKSSIKKSGFTVNKIEIAWAQKSKESGIYIVAKK